MRERSPRRGSQLAIVLAALLLALGAASLLPGRSAAAGDEVDTALIVSVDVSNSVDEPRYRLQMDGIAAALEDPGVIDAILSGANPEANRLASGLLGEVMADVPAEHRGVVAALGKESRERAAHAFGGAEDHCVHGSSPNSRTDCALRSLCSGSHFARTRSKAGRRGSMATKCSRRVKRSLAR